MITSGSNNAAMLPPACDCHITAKFIIAVTLSALDSELRPEPQFGKGNGRLNYRCSWESRNCSLLRSGPGRYSKPYRMPDGAHGVKVVGQIVERIQALRQQLAAGVKMPQIRPRIARAYPAAALRIDRPLVVRNAAAGYARAIRGRICGIFTPAASC